MNWKNVKLTDSYERDQNILDPYNFDTLLLEIHCNLRTENLTPEEITKHFNTILNSNNKSAKEVFKNNLNNIVKQAQKERKE
mgnify:CR=1 FL=1